MAANKSESWSLLQPRTLFLINFSVFKGHRTKVPRLKEAVTNTKDFNFFAGKVVKVSTSAESLAS